MELLNTTNRYRFELKDHEIAYAERLISQLPIEYVTDNFLTHSLDIDRMDSWNIAFIIQQYLRDDYIEEFNQGGTSIPVIKHQVTNIDDDAPWPISHNNKRFLEKFTTFLLDCNGITVNN